MLIHRKEATVIQHKHSRQILTTEKKEKKKLGQYL